MAFNASPVDFAPLYPGDETYGWATPSFGAVDLNTINPYKDPSSMVQGTAAVIRLWLVQSIFIIFLPC